MPNKQKYVGEQKNDANVLLRKLQSGEELFDGQQITGDEVPSDIYHLFEKFQKYDPLIFRAHWIKIKNDVKTGSN